MLKLSKVIKSWKEADALSAHISLYGFWSDTTFLTRSSNLGMVLSLAGVDCESFDNDEQQYAVKRLESALRSFGKGSNIPSKQTGLLFHLRLTTMNLLTQRLISCGSFSSRSATRSSSPNRCSHCLTRSASRRSHGT